jgi:hypothetical protein
MPKLTIEVDPKAWQLLHEQAERQGLTPEALARQLLLGELRSGGREVAGKTGATNRFMQQRCLEAHYSASSPH